jgi:hypothetical protein
MESRLLFVLVGLLAAASVLAQAYRWVDEDGVTHYTDRPVEGAEQVDLSEYSQDTGARLYREPPQRTTDDGEPGDVEPFRYETFSILSPRPEETLWNIEGVLDVTMVLSPGLRPGHRLRVYYNGQPRMVNGTSFQIEEVYRGVHNIQAEVIDNTGRVMIRSQPNRFYVQQNTVRR